MWLQRLTVKGFRNLRDSVLEFAPGADYLFGGNAAGKTSILEAIHYLAIGRSFRPAQDKDLIQFGANLFQVAGDAPAGDATLRRGEIRCDGQAKKLLLDGVEVERLSSYLGWLPVVTMLLDDIRLIRGGPAERRGFLDLALAKVSKPYLLAWAEYRRVLLQRNRVLVHRTDDAVLRTWNRQLIEAGAEVYRLRYAHLPGLLSDATRHVAELSGGNGVEFSYQPTVTPEGDLRANFLTALEKQRERERALGFTLSGPHRDDILIQKAGVELRRFGSEGEQRSASIALKLAEAQLLRSQRQEAPVFLLDEIASELDAERSQRLFALLETQGQMLYAAAKPILDSPLATRCSPLNKIFHIHAGEVKEA